MMNNKTAVHRPELLAPAGNLETAVAAGLRGLRIVLLGGLDRAEAGAAALNIDDETGDIGAGDIGDTLGFQRNSGRGGGGHNAGTGCGAA